MYLYMQQIDMDIPESLTNHFFCTNIDHWTMPLQGTLAPLLDGYLAGLRSGDVENAGNDRECRICNNSLFTFTYSNTADLLFSSPPCV